MSNFSFVRAVALRLSAVSVVCTFSAGGQAAVAATSSGSEKIERTASTASGVDSLVALALSASPTIAAARSRVNAARARIAPAGARRDPELMAGLLNFPVSQPGFSDFMTMKMIGIEQSLSYPGKLRVRTRVATDEASAEQWQLAAARLDVIRTVHDTYYDLAFLDRAFEIVTRNQGMLANLATVTEAQYSAGMGAQADLLRVRVEAARLSDQAAGIAEARRSALARLNAALDRPSDVAVASPLIPDRVGRAAVPDSASVVHFESSALGARAADSPLLPLDSLQALAMQFSPTLRVHEAEIQAQAARVKLAGMAHLPDFDVSLQYGERRGRSDMVSAVVSLPIPLQRRRNQDAEAAAARADLDALEAEHREAVDALRLEIATGVIDVERSRTQLALSVTAILPQARATLASARTGYQVGRVAFSSVLDAQASLFAIETAYWRSLTDFAKALASLQRTIGAEVLR